VLLRICWREPLCAGRIGSRHTRSSIRRQPEHRDAAECYFTQAIEMARGQSAKLFELRAAVSLARLWNEHAKHREARDLLAPIYEWFTEGFNLRALKEAKALLDELTDTF